MLNFVKGLFFFPGNDLVSSVMPVYVLNYIYCVSYPIVYLTWFWYRVLCWLLRMPLVEFLFFGTLWGTFVAALFQSSCRILQESGWSWASFVLILSTTATVPLHVVDLWSCTYPLDLAVACPVFLGFDLSAFWHVNSLFILWGTSVAIEISPFHFLLYSLGSSLLVWLLVYWSWLHKQSILYFVDVYNVLQVFILSVIALFLN